MQRVDNESKETDRTLNEAFTDLASLVDNAKEMVALAAKFEASIAKSQPDDLDQLTRFQLQMGIASPVTKYAQRTQSEIEFPGSQQVLCIIVNYASSYAIGFSVACCMRTM
jgi:hypothetical protein